MTQLLDDLLLVFAFNAYRVIDTVITGNQRLWAALEERNKIYDS